jgi:predicted nucleic acid-binding protein
LISPPEQTGPEALSISNDRSGHECDFRVLVLDAAAAVEYATIVVEREAAGRPISMADAQIAAVCRVHHCTLATRNVGDFERTGVTTVNPWSDTPPVDDESHKS